jgi:hypothetical protein
MIFPAMGSHGKGEAETQVEVLKHLGIIETSMDCPVYDKMEMIQIGTVKGGSPVYSESVDPAFGVIQADVLAGDEKNRLRMCKRCLAKSLLPGIFSIAVCCRPGSNR